MVRLIDANALQRAFDDAHKDEPDFFCCNFLNNAGNPSAEWDCVDEILENAPTVDAQPVKHGHWVETEPDPEDLKIGIDFRIECSECHDENSHITTNDSHEITGKTFWKSKFCPNCGAYMWGDAE